jgi:TPP-dependent pyruvate/acetoin dehydrogenase alpha subunit
MNKEDYISEPKTELSPKGKESQVVSRRTFIQGLGVIGVGPVFFSTGAVKRVKGQSVSTKVENLSEEQLIDMYTDMLKVRLWETKIKDLALNGGFRGAKISRDGAFGLGYRSDRELREWMAKDPIPRFRRFLVSEKVFTETRADEILQGVKKEVEEGAIFAEAQPVPEPEDGLLNVFAQGSVPLHKT